MGEKRRDRPINIIRGVRPEPLAWATAYSLLGEAGFNVDQEKLGTPIVLSDMRPYELVDALRLRAHYLPSASLERVETIITAAVERINEFNLGDNISEDSMRALKRLSRRMQFLSPDESTV